MSNSITSYMRRSGIDVTRDNAIAVLWGLVPPAPWTPEHEDELPEEVQDWDQFELEDDELVLQDFNPYHEPAGKPTGGQFAGKTGGSEAFVSPNTGNLTFEEAQKELGSKRQMAIAEISKEIDLRMGLESDITPVIGAWADGAENSLMIVNEPGGDEARERAALAMKGYVADQKAVLYFKPSDDGTEAMAQFVVPGKLDAVHDELLKRGIGFHTLEQSGSGVVVHVYASDQETIDLVGKAAKDHGATLTVTTGKGDFIGTQKSDGTDREQRDDARRIYEETIKAARGGKAGQVWKDIRNRWNSDKGKSWRARYGIEDEEVIDFNPLQPRDPRGSPTGGQWSAGTPDIYEAVFPEENEYQQFIDLKEKWASINKTLLPLVKTDPAGPEARDKLYQMQTIVKDMRRLHPDKGDIEDLGLPGGAKDVVVVGGGPGGLAATIIGGADGLDMMLVEAQDKLGGQSKYSSRIENYPGFPVGIAGDDLAQAMTEQAARFPSDIRTRTKVTGLTYDANTGLKTVTFDNGESVQARAVILSGGLVARTMKFPGSEGSNVVYMDGQALAEKTGRGDAVVIGGSNGAAQAALGVAETAGHVTLISRGKISDNMSDYQVTPLKNDKRITVIEDDEIASLERDDNGDPVQVITRNGVKVPANAVGLFVGSMPDTSWLPPELGVDTNLNSKTRGKIKTDANLETRIPGVFAIGDIKTNGLGRIGAAVGEGQIAVFQAYAYFEKWRLQKLKAEKAGGSHLRVGKIKMKDAIPATRERIYRNWDRMVDEVWKVDDDNPWFGQTIEALPPRYLGAHAHRH